MKFPVRLLAALALAVSLGIGVADAAPIRKPTVSQVTPFFGLATGGEKVTITGTNVKGVTKVLFGSTPGTGVTLVGRDSIQVVAPAHAIGLVDVRLVAGSVVSDVVSTDKFAFYTKPPVGATVSVSSYVPTLSICPVGATCASVAVTTAGFANPVSCRISDSSSGAMAGAWTQAANTTYRTGYSVSVTWLQVTCDTIVGRSTTWPL